MLAAGKFERERRGVCWRHVPCVCPAPQFKTNPLPLVFQARWRKLPAKGFSNRRESHVSPTVICYSVNRISGEMDLLACPLQRSEGRPLPRRCHLRRGAIVNARLGEKKLGRKKIKNSHSRLEFQWWREMKRRVEGLGGQRHSRSCGSLFPSQRRCTVSNARCCTTCCCLLRPPSCCQTATHSCLLTRNLTFDPESMWGLTVRGRARRVWLHTWLLLSTWVCMYSTVSRVLLSSERDRDVPEAFKLNPLSKNTS